MSAILVGHRYVSHQSKHRGQVVRVVKVAAGHVEVVGVFGPGHQRKAVKRMTRDHFVITYRVERE